MNEPPTLTAPYKDRSGGLIAFGIGQLVLGSCSSLMLPLSLASLLLSRKLPASAAPHSDPRTTAFVLLFYGGLATFFVTMGIGSLRARRWARTLTLVSSWTWLVSGLSGLAFWLSMLPAMRELLLNSTPAPAPAVLLVTLSCMTAFMLAVYVLLPVAFVLFYGSPHVRATCEARDPIVPWTDRCAPPVLAASLLSAMGALSLVGLVLTYRVLAFFVLLTGWPAALFGLALGAVYAWAAADLYRQRLRGWWVALGTALLLTLSGAGLCFTLDIGALYAAMGYPEEMTRQMASFGKPLLWAYVAAPALWAGFLLWVKRFLPGTSPAAETHLGPSTGAEDP